MARGITQEQVDAAADALLLSGERPTIERVRAALGTGSPNTLIRLLDVWWAALGQRLSAHARQLALPAAPEAVAQAAATFWSLALEHAGEQAKANYANSQLQLANAEAVAQAKVVEAIAARDQAMHAASAAYDARRAAETRLADLERLLTQQTDQIEDLHRQRDGLIQERDHAQRHGAALADELRQQNANVANERKLREEQQRATEDRWMQEVDRSRQETLAAQRDRSQLEKSHRSEFRSVAEQFEQAQRRVLELERRVVASEARAAAHEQEVERLHRQLAERKKGSPPGRTRVAANAAKTSRPGRSRGRPDWHRKR